MGSFSISHWLVVLAIVVLLFGAKKIPELAKGLGQGIKNFKDEMKEGSETATNAEATKHSEIDNKVASTEQHTATTKQA
jgi:sec-independent protein translocase protein TatA